MNDVRIAIDTNCLIAALTKRSGASAQVVRMWREGELEAVASEVTVREAEQVLGGGWLARMAGVDRVADLLVALRAETAWVEDPPRITDLQLKDEGDLRMVETAVAGRAQFIVTTDREFLSRRGYADVEFVTPGEFLGRGSMRNTG
jgi:putative PIN family toxin of toxin-antitoxin system